MKTQIVFYAGQLLIEFHDALEYNRWRHATCVGNYEFYNGSYVYHPLCKDRQWYRMDGTPVLLTDVPKELLLLKLLLT